MFIEKPLAAAYRQALALQQAAEASGSLLQTGLILRYEVQHAQFNRSWRLDVSVSWFPSA